MNSRTELLLYQLAWTMDKMLRPTWRNIDSSLESWAYGNGLLRQIQRLEGQKLLESRRDGKTGQRMIRLTDEGLSAGRVGGDPELRWQRIWDGKWRVILFDLPEVERALRRKLRHQLVTLGFGCLQRSAWISPDPLDELAGQLRRLAVDAAHLVLLESTPCGGESSADMVSATWNYAQINDTWEKLETHLDSAPVHPHATSKEWMCKWVIKERNLLQSCYRLDPFLPVELLPANYQGMAIWKKRRRVLRLLAKIHC